MKKTQKKGKKKMIDGKTIKSLYDDKPTLLEWLKRVEEQLEELKKVTNFDTLTANNVGVNQKLTANNVGVNQKLDAQNIHAAKGNLDELLVKDVSVSKAVYLHKLTFNIDGQLLEKTYLSTNPNPYKNLADIFAHSAENNLGHNEIFTSRSGATYFPMLFFFNIGENGIVQKGFNIDYDTLGLSAIANSDIASMTITDRVVGSWGA